MFNQKQVSSKKKRTKKSTSKSRKVASTYADRVLTLLNKNPDYQALSAEQAAFAVWFSQPKSERGNLMGFAKKIGVSRTTLWHWKRNQAIMDLRNEVMICALKEFTPDILYNLAERASDTNKKFNAIPAIKLFLQYVEGWNENAPPPKPDIIVNFGMNRSQFIQPEDAVKPIDVIPKPQKKLKSAAVTAAKARHG